MQGCKSRIVNGGRVTGIIGVAILIATVNPSSAMADPAPINFAGTGQSATGSFSVTQGLAVIHANCSCTGNFIVELLDSSGETKDVVVNVIGPYDGSEGEGLEAGNYSFKIQADAAWTIDVTQPRDRAGATLPQTFTGRGQQMVGPFAADGAVRLEAQNATTEGGNFIVEVINASGDLQDVAINEIGSFSGSTVSNNLSGGPYYLNVNSDGNWTITASSIGGGMDATATAAPPAAAAPTPTLVATGNQLPKTGLPILPLVLFGIGLTLIGLEFMTLEFRHKAETSGTDGRSVPSAKRDPDVPIWPYGW